MYICLWTNGIRKDLYNGMQFVNIFSDFVSTVVYFCFNTVSFPLQSGPSISSTVDWGVNYRALNDLFQISQNRKSSIAYEIGVQMVEIYNEQVRDLLSNEISQKRYPSSVCPVFYHLI